MKLLFTLFLSIIFYEPLFTLFPDTNLRTILEYDEGLKIAEEEQKPIFLLFTGASCPQNDSIQSLIENSFKSETLLTNDFVNVWLYVDDKTALPKKEYIMKDGNKMIIKTYGRKWAILEQELFDLNVQPAFAILDDKGSLLTQPVIFSDLQMTMEEYLLTGLTRYQSRQK